MCIHITSVCLPFFCISVQPVKVSVTVYNAYIESVKISETFETSHKVFGQESDPKIRHDKEIMPGLVLVMATTMFYPVKTFIDI